MTGTEVLIAAVIVSTIATVATTTISAQQQSRASKRQARQADAQARQFELQGAQQGNEILREQLAALAQSNAAAAASGIDPFSGSPESVKRGIRERAQRQLDISKGSSLFNVAGAKAESRQLSLAARAAIVQGLARSSGAVLGAATTAGSA